MEDKEKRRVRWTKRLPERVWVRYFLSHRTLKIPSIINRPVSGSKIVGKTERKKAVNFDSWLTSEHFLLPQLHGKSFQFVLLLRASRRILDRVRLMLWISYIIFSFHLAILFRPVERIATNFLSHSKRLGNMKDEFYFHVKTFPLQSAV